MKTLGFYHKSDLDGRCSGAILKYHIPDITLVGIDKGFDKEEQKTIILAKANMLIYLSDQIRKNAGITNQFADVFNETFELKTKNILGTLRDVNYQKPWEYPIQWLIDRHHQKDN